MHQVDVLIIGAGPTGLMMAIECVRHGLSCHLIDKRDGKVSDISRAVAIQPRTLEMFSQIGLIDRFLEQGIKIQGANPTYHKEPLTHFSFSSLHSPYPFILSLEQTKTEKILEEYALSLGVVIHESVECIQIQEMPASVVATLEEVHSKEQSFCKASYLVGCDGAHSFVRKYLQLSFNGTTFDAIFSLADVCVKWDYPHDEVTAFFGKEGIVAAIPLPEKDRYRLIFEVPQMRAKEPTLEQIEALLQKKTGTAVQLYNPRWISNFHINTRLSKSHQRGRIFLAGDAAHIHSPVGGQGMNTGLQDAYNLGWKLSLVMKKNAPPSLLNTYHLERHYVAKKLLAATSKASYLATLSNPIGIYLRNLLIKCVGKIPFLQKKLLLALSQTAICYPKSSLTVGSKAGKRAPDAPIFYRGIRTHLYTLWQKSTHFHVIVFCHKKPHECIERLKDLSISCPTLYVTLDPIKDGKIEIAHDSHGLAHTLYEVSSPTLYVIRPDGYIGWHGALFEKEDLVSYLKLTM
jgi:2-polyprenyl-6-methoxyphenol hydroxylase-like FAD-dependent oxidoreductase